MIAFGPIPSRRLGLSLGINNIVSQKVCSYSCAYCQVGVTRYKTIQPTGFYAPEILVKSVAEHLKKLDKMHWPDYLTFVANGEPTLDRNLGEEIRLLKKLRIPIAVITNASLLYNNEIRENVMEADWVSVKVDTISKLAWRKINRPSIDLKLQRILSGIEIFAEKYKGKLNTETMLVEKFNDLPSQIKQTAAFIASLNPETAYISIPTRPPALKGIKPVTEKQLALAWKIFGNFGLKTEILADFEGNNTGFTGNAFDDILNITAVHPLREDTMVELIKKENADMSVVDALLLQGLLKKTAFNGKNYYFRSYHYKTI